MRTFGIELEITGLNASQAAEVIRAIGLACNYEGYTHRTTPHWKTVTDASIRGVGCEVVSPVLPANEESFRQVEAICNALRAAGAGVNTSTGYHVHVGGTDEHAITLDCLKNLVKISTKLDDVIDQVVAPSRRTAARNCFCRSLLSMVGGEYAPTDALEVKRARIEQAFKRVDACKTLTDLTGLFSSRYYKINVQAMLRHGTVEFRQHQGTVDAQKVVAWLRLCIGLVDFATKARAIKNRRKEAFAYVIWMAKGGHTETGMLPTSIKRYLSSRVRKFARGQEQEVVVTH